MANVICGKLLFSPPHESSVAARRFPQRAIRAFIKESFLPAAAAASSLKKKTLLHSGEDLTINYGILGGQFHFEKVDPGDLTSKYGCYGQPDRQTTYYIANANGYQTLSQNQFEQVVHLFPLNCGGNVILQQQQQQQRAARLLADNQRMAEAIQTKLGQDGTMSPTMVLLVPFCPNNENDALNFLQQWRQHATPVNVSGYLFGSKNTASSNQQKK